MTHGLRILKGAISGTLFGLAIGAGMAGILLLIAMPNEYPMDRWFVGIRIAAVIIISSSLVGLVAGVASKVPENGLSLLKSLAVVAGGGIAAIPFAPGIKTGLFLIAPICGIFIGGVAAVLLGIRTKCQKTQDL